MRETIRFRDATEDDREWAAAVMASTDPWLRLGRSIDACRLVLHNPRVEVVVAWLEGERLGFAIVDAQGLAGAPYLKAIAVDAMERSAGVGSAILDHVESRWGTQAGNLFLCVSSFNTRARDLYERRGYAVVGTLETYLVHDADEILMRKRFGLS
jgi:ribosomal-protein-alanine N-acetyltransferase